MHAITSDPRKCVYMMLDFDLVWPGVHERRSTAAPTNGTNGDAAAISESEEEDDDDDADLHDSDEPAITEVWLVPRSDAEVEQIYQAMTECQLLNPDLTADAENNMMRMGDGDDSMSDVDEEDDHAIDEEETEEQMQQLNLNDERFADAD